MILNQPTHKQKLLSNTTGTGPSFSEMVHEVPSTMDAGTGSETLKVISKQHKDIEIRPLCLNKRNYKKNLIKKSKKKSWRALS